MDAALAWSRTNEPDLAVSIATGFGWTWVVLGDGTAAATRVRTTLTPATPPSARASALLLAGWLEASAGDVALAWDDLAEAGRIADQLDADVLRADVSRHRAFVCLQQGMPADALAAATDGLATYRRLGLDWETAASLVLAAYGSLMQGDTATAARDGAEALGILTPIGDSWGLVHAQAMLGVASPRRSIASTTRSTPCPVPHRSRWRWASSGRRRSTWDRWPACSSERDALRMRPPRSTGVSRPRRPVATVGWRQLPG